jgi:hypothetical protein
MHNARMTAKDDVVMDWRFVNHAANPEVMLNPNMGLP